MEDEEFIRGFLDIPSSELGVYDSFSEEDDEDADPIYMPDLQDLDSNQDEAEVRDVALDESINADTLEDAEDNLGLFEDEIDIHILDIPEIVLDRSGPSTSHGEPLSKRPKVVKQRKKRVVAKKGVTKTKPKKSKKKSQNILIIGILMIFHPFRFHLMTLLVE